MTRRWSFSIIPSLLKSRVEYLIGYEGNDFALTGNVKDDLLSITSVHPMRKEAVLELPRRADVGWEVVETLLKNGSLIELEYQGKEFYMRKLFNTIES